jgi:predicted transcriptional regulator of viral defense system
MANTKTLGYVSSRLISTLYEENKAIFRISDAQRILGKRYNETTDLLSELVKRKVITRLKAGKFLIIPQQLGKAEQYLGNWFVAGREVANSEKYYIAFYSAMHYWGMLTQPLLKIFVATPKRQIVPYEMRGKLVLVFINEKSIWGIRDEWITSNERVRISDIEKTIIDTLTHPEYCGGITEVAKGIWLLKEKIEYKKLQNYIRKQNKNVVAKRLGYILEIFDINQPELLGHLREYVKDRYDKFDPNLSENRINKNKWRLIDNVGREQILNLVRR